MLTQSYGCNLVIGPLRVSIVSKMYSNRESLVSLSCIFYLFLGDIIGINFNPVVFSGKFCKTSPTTAKFQYFFAFMQMQFFADEIELVFLSFI